MDVSIKVTACVDSPRCAHCVMSGKKSVTIQIRTYCTLMPLFLSFRSQTRRSSPLRNFQSASDANLPSSTLTYIRACNSRRTWCVPSSWFLSFCRLVLVSSLLVAASTVPLVQWERNTIALRSSYGEDAAWRINGHPTNHNHAKVECATPLHIFFSGTCPLSCSKAECCELGHEQEAACQGPRADDS